MNQGSLFGPHSISSISGGSILSAWAITRDNASGRVARGIRKLRQHTCDESPWLAWCAR
jgi:hypothetical protein